MAIGTEFLIDYVNKRIYHDNGTTIYTCNQLYTHIQDTFDELNQMDDTVPMSAQTPTEYTLINGWFIDDESVKFLKGGAIQTSGNENSVRVITLSSTGYTGCVASDIGKTVTGATTGDTGVLLAYNNTTYKWWVRMVDSGDLFDDNDEALSIGSGTGAGTVGGAISTTGEHLWANVYTLGTIEEDDNQQVYIIQNQSKIDSTSWFPETASGTQHIDVLIKVKEVTEIASGKITVFLRHYPSAGNADLYDHFEIDLTNGGRNAVPLATSPDLNNTTATATVSGYTSVGIYWVNATITHGSITSGPYTEFETITGSISGATGKFIRENSGTMTLANVSATAFVNNDILTGGTSGATSTASAGQTIARTTAKAFEQGTNKNYSVVINCATRPLSEVYEYLKYVTRYGSSYTTYGVKMQSAALGIVRIVGEQYITPFIDYDTPANTFSPVKASPFGTFAGGKFFGAKGIWIQNMASADIQNFQLIDSDGTTQTPPNKQSITISNLLSGDRVAVFRASSGTTIDKAVFTLAASNDSGDTTLIVNESIPNDTPATGVVRVVDTSDTGSTRETRYTYTSWSGSTFSGLSPALDRTYTATSDTAYVPFIDATATGTSATVQVIYVSDRDLVIRVRRKAATAILPFETTGTFGSTGYSTSAIRTADTIVS